MTTNEGDTGAEGQGESETPTMEPKAAVDFPRFPAMRGRVGYWYREASDTGERGNIDLLLDHMQQLGGGDLWCPKVADGLNWQSTFDEVDPFTGLDALRSIRNHCAGRGVALLPVVVPRGGNPSEEANLHGSIARACGCLLLDIEPYLGFWDQAPYNAIPGYLGQLRRAAGDAYLIIQPDPRPAARAAIDLQGLAGLGIVDAVAGQHYVGWASIGWTDVQQEIARFFLIASWFPEAYVTLYGVERKDLAAQFWRGVSQLPSSQAAAGCNIFDLGPMDAAALQFFAGLPKPLVAAVPIPGTEPVPPPVPPLPPVPAPPTPKPGPPPAPADLRLVNVGDLVYSADALLQAMAGRADQAWAEKQTRDRCNEIVKRLSPPAGPGGS